MTSQRRPGRAPPASSPAALHQKSNRKPGWLFCFCSVRNSPESGEKPGRADTPGRGPWRKLQVQPQSDNWRRQLFPAPWVGKRFRSLINARDLAVGPLLAKERGVRRGRAPSRASPALSKTLPRDAHFHSWICAWDLINVTSAQVL